MSITDAVQDVSNKVFGTEKDVEKKVPNEVTDAVEQEAGKLTGSDVQKPSTEQEPKNLATNTVADDAKVAVPEDVPAAAPGIREPVVGAGEQVKEHTTVYTEATPQVLESENHHVLTESVPITHTSIPDYNERATAAPPIVGSDLYSILRDSSQQRSLDYTKTLTADTTTSAPAVGAGTVESGVPSYLQNSSQFERTSSLPWSTSAPTAAASGASVPATSTTAAEEAPKGLEQFEPTDEQAWSVRGPASTVQSRGPAALVQSTDASTAGVGAAGTDATGTGAVAGAAGTGAGAGATGAGAGADSASSQIGKPGEAVKGTQDKLGELAKDVGGKPGDALQGAKEKVGDVSKKPGDVAKQVESKAGDVKKQATDAVDQAKDAGKAQKKGLLQKVKKALKIGKDYK